MAYEPESLYWYGAGGSSAEAIFAALYDGPVELAGFALRSPLLTKVPSTTDGDLRVEETTVATGEVYLDPLTLTARNLAYGDSYLPSGCISPECVRVFQGGQITMDRMVADFHTPAGAVLVGRAADSLRLGILLRTGCASGYTDDQVPRGSHRWVRRPG
jgi:hypothetical protein